MVVKCLPRIKRMGNSLAAPSGYPPTGKIVLIYLVLFLSGCLQNYSPPATRGNNKFLVVDGFINAGVDSTIFLLSNSTNLGDTLSPSPELGAQLFIEGSAGFSGPLSELGNGRYGGPALGLDTTQQYRIRIKTIEGNQYLSDFVPALQTPPIDSISWAHVQSGLQIYVTTHDSRNLVSYYRWLFTETWESHSIFSANLALQNNGIVNVPPNQARYYCWSSDNSTDIAIGTSAKVSQPIVYEQPLTIIPEGSVKLSYKYSVLVNQFPLTNEAYTYWLNLKQNTEQLGSIFGPQPVEVAGNIHCVNNPSLPVLGYVSAGTTQKQRKYINNQDLGFWAYSASCWDTVVSIPTFYGMYEPFGYVPITYYQLTSVYIAQPNCVYCDIEGLGDTAKPSFWP
jgi:hypothetical protein